jgi:hypothetical protein
MAVGRTRADDEIVHDVAELVDIEADGIDALEVGESLLDKGDQVR